MPDWKHCEGQLANGEFPLERYLGGNETRVVFLTRFASGRAAIKLERADPVQAGEVVKRWKRAAVLHHRHLAAIHAAGTCVLDGVPLAYLVTEYAEENLAEVLRDRALSNAEAREMLLPVAEALAYLHSQGLAHGDLKPSNILAVGDTVKISSEAVAAGDASADIRALGVTLVEALTQRAATLAQNGQDPAVDALPRPFGEMAENCLHRNPRLRWSADKIAAWLRSPGQPAASPRVSAPPAAPPPAKPVTGKPRTWLYAAGALVVIGVAIVGGVVIRRTPAPAPSAVESVPPAPAPLPSGPPPSAQRAEPPSEPKAEPKTEAKTAPKTAPKTEPKVIPPVSSDRAAEPPRGTPAAKDEITRRVLPEISAKARNTIQGKPVVVVRATVDPAGNVTEAILERTFSPYFSKLTLEAARRWQFAPEEGAGPRNWILRFEFTRTNTQVTARKAGRD